MTKKGKYMTNEINSGRFLKIFVSLNFLLMFCCCSFAQISIEGATLKRGKGDTLMIYYSNQQGEPIELQEVYVDGLKVASGQDKAFWMDIFPKSVPSLGWGNIKIRYKQKQNFNDKLQIKLLFKDGRSIEKDIVPVMENCKSGILSFNADSKSPDISLSHELKVLSYNFNDKLDQIYIYLYSPVEISLNNILLDGQSFLERCDARTAKTPQGIFYLLKLSCPEALKEGSYKVLKISTNKGYSFCPVRVLVPFFPIAMYRVQEDRTTPRKAAPEAWVKDCFEHNINTLTVEYLERGGSVEIAKKYNMKMQSWFNMARAKNKDVAGWYICDEPSGCQPNPSKIIKNLTEQRKASGKPAIITDWSSKDLENYSFVDVFAMDIYPVFNDSLRVIEKGFMNIRTVAYPSSCWVAPQAFRRNSAKNKEWFSRFPTPEEERLLTFMPLALGAKGILYFAYNIELKEPVYGVGLTEEDSAKELWTEIGRINKEVMFLEKILINSENIPLNVQLEYPGKEAKEKDVRKSVGPRGIIKWRPDIVTRTLLSFDGNIILFVFNHDYEYTKDGFKSNHVNNVNVKVDIPEWVKPEQLLAVNYETQQEVKFDRKGSTLEFSIPDLGVCNIYLLKASDSLKK